MIITLLKQFGCIVMGNVSKIVGSISIIWLFGFKVWVVIEFIDIVPKAIKLVIEYIDNYDRA